MPVKQVEYAHIPCGEPVEALSGRFTPMREVQLDVDGRKILYVIGEAVVECSCCGSESFAYAMVPGFIAHWQTRTNEDGLPVSKVEPVTKLPEKKKIRSLIKAAESVFQIDFL
jgi:hypothetical protein